MRGQRYLIGALLGVIGALIFSGVAESVPTGLTLRTSYSPGKEDKKSFGGVTLQQHQEFAYDAFVTSRGPREMVFTLPRDAKFVPGNMPVCPLSQIHYNLDAEARAACPNSIIGQGSLEVGSIARMQRATITFFRGDPALNQDIISHIVFEDSLLVLNTFGDISGRTLDFDNLPDTPGTVLSTIDTNFYKQKTGKSTFFVMARCGKKREWTTSLTTGFHSGESLSTRSMQKCRQKATKKESHRTCRRRFPAASAESAS